MSVITTFFPRCDLCHKRFLNGNGVDADASITYQGGHTATKTFSFCDRCFFKHPADVDRIVLEWQR